MKYHNDYNIELKQQEHIRNNYNWKGILVAGVQKGQ